MKKKLHWTQTPAGRKKMAKIMKQRQAKRLSGPSRVVARKSHRSLAREEIMKLAKTGAERRLEEISAEAIRLRMFLRGLK